MFIRLINVSGVLNDQEDQPMPVYVNADKITQFNQSGAEHKVFGIVTVVCFEGESHLEVIETPEEIMRLIERQKKVTNNVG